MPDDETDVTQSDADGSPSADSPPAGDAGAGSTLPELRARVAALEVEQGRLLARYAAELEAANARMRLASSSAPPTPQREVRREPIAPAYLARALVAVENDLADMERSAAYGDDEGAARSKVAAAVRTCSTLRRLCDDDAFHQMLMVMQGHAEEFGGSVTGQVGGRIANASFRDAEVALLELVGLTRPLAATHVDAAIAAYHGDPAGSLARVQNPLAFLADLRRLRDASCLTADLLSQGLREEESRQRWKKLLTFGLGGTVIVAANGVGTALLGPGGVAASGVVGSAAVGVAAKLVS